MLNILISLLPELRGLKCDNILYEATSHVSMVMVICGLKDTSASWFETELYLLENKTFTDVYSYF